MKRQIRYKRPRRNFWSLYFEARRAVRTKQIETELALTDNNYFKYVFGRPESTSFLCDLLKVILTCVEERSVKSLTLKDPILNPLFYRQKSSFLDIVAVDETNRIFNVEMQAYQEKNLPERFLDYVCGLYSRQLQAGEDYDRLHPVVGIMLLDDKVWLKVVKEFKEKKSVDEYKDRYFDKVKLQSRYTGAVYSEHLTIILLRVPDPNVTIEELVDKTGNRQLAFWLKTLASPNAAYDKELDSFEAEAPGLKDLRKDMRSFLAGIGGQYALLGSRKNDSYWERILKSAEYDAKEEEATDNLVACLEARFHKTREETVPLLDSMRIEEIRALTRFAYTCDNYDSFIQHTKETQHSDQPS